MPRNGDGSSDNGPIDGHEILHGTKGDKSLQHTQHVASMPKHEDGEALPGMNASGGAAAPLKDASEEYGASAPRNERYEGGHTSTSNDSTLASHSARTGGSSSSTTGKSQQQSGSNAKSSHEAQYGTEQHDADGLIREKAERFVNLDEEDGEQTGAAYKSGSGAQRSGQQHSGQQQSSQQHSSQQHSSQQHSINTSKSSHDAHYATEQHDADGVDRQNAERYVNLNEDDVQHAGSANKSSDGAQRSSQRAPKEVGPKEDIEQLHGKASLPGNDKGNERSSGRIEHQHGHKSGNDDDDRQQRDSGHQEGGLESMRHTAEKFVNLEDE